MVITFMKSPKRDDSMANVMATCSVYSRKAVKIGNKNEDRLSFLTQLVSEEC